jgi:hypothetical protein
MFAIELVVPFLILTTRNLRTLAFVLFIVLQVIVSASGNFGFFNLLAMVLCLPLLDDAWFENENTRSPSLISRQIQRILFAVHVPAVIVVMLVSSMLFVSMIVPDVRWPPAFTRMASAIAPFRSVNSYGLFAVMTKDRPEIIIEGSRNGRDWLRSEFEYKPGEEQKTPRVVAPHMPRLDWQMWFAALGHHTHNPWLYNFMARLMEGSPDVVALLDNNPFGSEPPAYMRAVLYQYTFASREEKEGRNVWWRRELKGLYCPIVSRP